MQTFQNFVVGLFKMIPVSFRFVAFVLMAFLAVLSFFHVGSYYADQHHLNWLFWLAGIVLSILVVTIVKAGLEENK